MKKKFPKFVKRLRKDLSKYLATNRLYIIFVVFCMIETMLLRRYTIGSPFAIKPLICDLALLIIIGLNQRNSLDIILLG